MKMLSQRYLDKSPLNFESRLDLDLNLGILLNEFLPLWDSSNSTILADSRVVNNYYELFLGIRCLSLLIQIKEFLTAITPLRDMANCNKFEGSVALGEV